MDNKKTGIFISSVRKERGMTQKELAEKIGVTDKAVSRWETGKGFPDVSILKSLSEALGITITELINGEPAAPEAMQEKADNAILETIYYFKSMARKTIAMLLFLSGVCLGLFSFLMTGRSTMLFPILGIFTILMGIAVLSAKHFPFSFQIAVSPKKSQLVSAVFLAAALSLEMLPYGIRMDFGAGPEETVQIMVSYFNLLPFGYGNFFPLITAVLTAGAVAVSFFSFFREKDVPRPKNFLYLFCIFILACSGVSLFFGITLVGGLIFLCILIATVFQAATNRKASA